MIFDKTAKGIKTMKTIFCLAAFCVSLATLAVQCEGGAKTGERCTDKAVEGASCETGHKEQAKDHAKPKASAKLKDDGTCWALTESGTRCKRRKNGESDYCKQHAPSVKPSKPVSQCRALTYDGTQCTRRPVEGGRYCIQHNK